MARDLRPKVRRLMSEGKGDRVIAETLDITRHEARKLIREVEMADAKQAVQAPAMPTVLSDDPDAWALLINGAFRRSYDSIIEAGKLLIAAKEKLGPRGTWLELVETKLDFSPDTAQRLMAIARDERLTNTAHVRFLPRSYSTLHELTKLSDEEFQRGIEQNIIRPDMERKDVEIIRPAPQRALPGPSSDGSGSPEEETRGPAAPSVQQGLATPATDGDIRDGGNVAKPEGQTDVPDGLPVSPGPSEAPMPGGGLAIAHRRQDPEGLDYYPTPPFATRALMQHVFPHLERDKQCKFQKVWEPACGMGHMAEPLKEYFREVLATDIEDRGYQECIADFLACDHPQNSDWIITNPPFGDKTEAFILKALDLDVTGVAMFTRLQMLEGTGRFERIYSKRPPSQVAFFAERVPIHKGRWTVDGDTMTAYCWLIWIKGMEPQPPFWIPPGCREALSKPEDLRLPHVFENEAPAAEAAE